VVDFLLSVEVFGGVPHIAAAAGLPDGRYVLAGNLGPGGTVIETRIFDPDGALLTEIRASNARTGAICARNLLPLIYLLCPY
jgi:hypothetical protein